MYKRIRDGQEAYHRDGKLSLGVLLRSLKSIFITASFFLECQACRPPSPFFYEFSTLNPVDRETLLPPGIPMEQRSIVYRIFPVDVVIVIDNCVRLTYANLVNKRVYFLILIIGDASEEGYRVHEAL